MSDQIATTGGVLHSTSESLTRRRIDELKRENSNLRERVKLLEDAGDQIVTGGYVYAALRRAWEKAKEATP